MKPKGDVRKVFPLILWLSSLRTDGVDKLGPAAPEFLSDIAVQFWAGETQTLAPFVKGEGTGGVFGGGSAVGRGGVLRVQGVQEDLQCLVECNNISHNCFVLQQSWPFCVKKGNNSILKFTNQKKFFFFLTFL